MSSPQAGIAASVFGRPGDAAGARHVGSPLRESVAGGRESGHIERKGLSFFQSRHLGTALELYACPPTCVSWLVHDGTLPSPREPRDWSWDGPEASWTRMGQRNPYACCSRRG